MKTESNSSTKAKRSLTGQVVRVKLEGPSKFTISTKTDVSVTASGSDLKQEVVIKVEGEDCMKENAASASISKVKLEGTLDPRLLLTSVGTTDTVNCSCGVKCNWEKDLPVFKIVIAGLVEICTNDPARSQPTNRFIRQQVYRRYALIHYPYLRKAQRIRIPLCVVQKIRNEWPNRDDVGYVGHKDYISE